MREIALEGAGGGPGDSSSKGGCGCRVAGESAPSPDGAPWIVALAVAVGWMRVRGRSLSRRSASCLVAGLLATLGITRSARADGAAAAEALYREGRELMEKGDLSNACAKLAESERLDASSGTALNLALCHFKEGKTATAWAEYLVAARLARQQGRPERVQEAEQKAAELERDLSRIKLHVTTRVAGMEIRLDETVLEGSSIGSALPIDPGAHRLTIRAPGYKVATLDVSIGPSRDNQTVNLPALEVEASTDVAVAPSLPALTVAKGRGPLPWVVGGVGLAAVGVGATFGGLALSSYNAALDACPNRTGCSSQALSDRSSAGTEAKVADIGIGVGVVAVGVATVLLLTRPSQKGDSKSSRAPSYSVAAAPAAGGFRTWLTCAF